MDAPEANSSMVSRVTGLHSPSERQNIEIMTFDIWYPVCTFKNIEENVLNVHVPPQSS